LIPAHLQGMGQALEIGFSDALAELQSLLGKRVCALVNVGGTFSGCVMEGELVRVVTLPPDDSAVNIVVGAQRIVVDPEDVDVLLVGNPSEGQGSLEFHLPSGVVIGLERA
jgi:hypothetical protein